MIEHGMLLGARLAVVPFYLRGSFGCRRIKAQGRWNLMGHPILYTSATLSLAILERRAHTRLRPRDEVAMQIEVPDGVH
jgi:RES domain-containing protein